MSTNVMNQKCDGLLGQALALSDAERAMIAQALLESLPEHYDVSPYVTPAIREAWLAEVRRRAAEVQRGETVMFDGEEVMRELREKYSK